MGSLHTKWKGQTAAFLMDYGFNYMKGVILDAGCGNKPYRRFAEMSDVPFTEWVGVDIRPVAEIQADLTALPVKDHIYDNVLCTDTMQLLLQPAEVLREFHRVLKDDGFLVLTVAGNRPENGEDIWGFRLNGLAWLLKETGFEPLVVEGYGANFLDEGENFLMQDETGVPMTQDLFRGWLDYLDKKYPATLGIVAKKL